MIGVNLLHSQGKLVVRDDPGLLVGWGGRIRTCECRYQKPVPYHLATPQQALAPLREKRRLYRPSPALEGWMGSRGGNGYDVGMSEASILNFHAHLYYDPDQVELAKEIAAAARQRFGVTVGHFHLRPVGPHPRGSVQLTVPTEQFGDVAQWLTLNRGPLTVFAHANTGDDLADHTDHVIWFGPSEPLDLSIFS
jgi:aromatic ring-cleaving dioxygenase